jgi:hypothetical protein
MAKMSTPMDKTPAKDFATIKEMLESRENFSFARFSDGELLVCNNAEVSMQPQYNFIGGSTFEADNAKDDVKHFDPKVHTETRRRLVSSLLYNEDNYFKGLNCYCCTGQMWSPHLIERERKLAGFDVGNLTWANVLINDNYKKFVDEIIPILKTRDLYMVVNKAADLEASEFDVKKSFRIGENCMVNDIGLIDEMKKYIDDNSIENGVFLIAASSLSNMIIHECHMHNRKNTYIDIGSSLNPFLPGIESRREYMKQLDGSLTMESCRW